MVSSIDTLCGDDGLDVYLACVNPTNSATAALLNWGTCAIADNWRDVDCSRNSDNGAITILIFKLHPSSLCMSVLARVLVQAVQSTSPHSVVIRARQAAHLARPKQQACSQMGCDNYVHGMSPVLSPYWAVTQSRSLGSHLQRHISGPPRLASVGVMPSPETLLPSPLGDDHST